MLTIIFLFIMASSGWAAAALARQKLNQQQYAHRMLPSADSDEDVISVLEVSESPLAPKLLAAAEHLSPDAPWKHCTSSHTPGELTWELLVDDMQLEQKDEDRVEVLREWLLRGFEMTHFERVEVMKYILSAEMRAVARAMITNARNNEPI